MRKLLPCLVLLATVLTFCRASMAIELPLATDSSRAGNTLVLVGGMGGGTGGGMGGMAGGGMGGMTGGGMGGGMGGFGAPPGNSPSGLYGGVDRTGAGVQPAQYYLCVTPYDRCSLASSPGSLRSGSSCTCSTGHRGNIK
jgi:hypothetical protein